jgi:hypothetical protein
VGRYHVRFSATTPGALAPDAARRLTSALSVLPGVVPSDEAGQEDEAHVVSAGFAIDVDQAMADAARDGSRLAKEALNLAGMPEAQLVELVVRLLDTPGD